MNICEETISDLIFALERMQDAVGDIPIRKKMVFGPAERIIAIDLLELHEVDNDEKEYTVLVIG